MDLPIKTKENEPEIMLWRAVLQRALYDVLYIGTNSEMLDARDEALKWFQQSKDFEIVCDNAELPTRWVIYLFEKFLENPKWQPTLTPTQLDPTRYRKQKPSGSTTD